MEEVFTRLPPPFAIPDEDSFKLLIFDELLSPDNNEVFGDESEV
jgi:hypothetical protein